MKFLIDANVEQAMIAWLEAEGHDLLIANRIEPGAPDDALLRLAIEHGRIIVTRDKDFGDLVFRDLHGASGIVLIRISTVSGNPLERLGILKQSWPVIAEHAMGNLVLVTRDRIRIRPLSRRA